MVRIGRGQDGGGPALLLRPQREPQQAGAEEEGKDQGGCHPGLGSLGFDPFAQLGFDLAGHREAVGLLLGEDQLVVDGDFEDAPAAPDQLALDAELAFNLRRQTGGARVVVSHRAVFDAHLLHADLLSWTIVVQAVRTPCGSLIADPGPTLYCSVEERNETDEPHVRGL
jgi:hypothetical protein